MSSRKKRTSGSIADPNVLLEQAMAEAEKEPPRHPAVAYAPIVETLRRKGLSWSEIHEWLTERGVDFSINALQTANRKWGQSDAFIEWQASNPEAEMAKM